MKYTLLVLLILSYYGTSARVIRKIKHKRTVFEEFTKTKDYENKQSTLLGNYLSTFNISKETKTCYYHAAYYKRFDLFCTNSNNDKVSNLIINYSLIQNFEEIEYYNKLDLIKKLLSHHKYNDPLNIIILNADEYAIVDFIEDINLFNGDFGSNNDDKKIKNLRIYSNMDVIDEETFFKIYLTEQKDKPKHISLKNYNDLVKNFNNVDEVHFSFDILLLCKLIKDEPESKDKPEPKDKNKVSLLKLNFIIDNKYFSDENICPLILEKEEYIKEKKKSSIIKPTNNSNEDDFLPTESILKSHVEGLDRHFVRKPIKKDEKKKEINDINKNNEIEKGLKFIKKDEKKKDINDVIKKNEIEMGLKFIKKDPRIK